jgi:hypothetical protein
MKLRETDDRRIGLSFGNGEQILTCQEVVRLCIDLLHLAVDISDRVDPPTHPPLQTFEFDTVTIDPNEILVQTSDDEGGAIG